MISKNNVFYSQPESKSDLAQDHISRQKSILAQRQTKANKWEPKLRQLAKENEQRLNEMERQILFVSVLNTLVCTTAGFIMQHVLSMLRMYTE